MDTGADCPKFFGDKESVFDHYEVGHLDEDILGKGYFAVVRKGKCKKTGDIVAVKCIDKSKVEDKRKLLAEARILASFADHPRIVSMHGVYDSPEYLYIVMELMSKNNLFDEIIEREFLTEQQASTVIKQIFEALVFIHDQKVVHRDIKLENLLLKTKGDLSTIKVADFGLSKDCSLSMPKTAVGTPFYVSPDLLIAVEDGSPYTYAVDMWAMGILLFIVLSGRLPFTGEDDEELFDNILTANIVWKRPQFDNVSANAKDLISKLLCKDPACRPTAKEALQHPFITSNDGGQLHASLSSNLSKTLLKRQKPTTD